MKPKGKSATELRVVEALESLVKKFDYNPGHSDLDDEQRIEIPLTLGEFRKARAALARWRKS